MAFPLRTSRITYKVVFVELSGSGVNQVGRSLLQFGVGLPLVGRAPVQDRLAQHPDVQIRVL